MNWLVHGICWQSQINDSLIWFTETFSNLLNLLNRLSINLSNTLWQCRKNSVTWFSWTILNKSIYSSDSLGQYRINGFINLIHWDNLKWIDIFTWFTESVSSSNTLCVGGGDFTDIKRIDSFTWFSGTISSKPTHSCDSCAS